MRFLAGGIGAVHQMVRELGLPELLDSRLGILKRARPYQDSDHVLDIAYNLLCGGQQHTADQLRVLRMDFRTPPYFTRSVGAGAERARLA